MTGHLTIPPPAVPLTRDRLALLPRRRLHAGRNPSKAAVDLVTIEGREVVVKDLAGRPWPVRVLLGPWQLDRETRAYRRLAGSPGIPGWLARPDRLSIALTFVDGRTLADARPGEIPPSFFDELERRVAEMHRRGVAHGDLHHRDVLAGRDGAPYLVDFSTSLTIGPRAGAVRRFLFRQMCGADRRAVAKLRQRLLSEPGRALPPRPALYRAGRAVKRLIDLVRRRRPERRGGVPPAT